MLIKLATQLNISEYKPMMKPSRASNPVTSLSGILSVGDGDRNGALGIFGVLIPPDGKPNKTRDNSSTVVPSKFAARWADWGLANWYLEEFVTATNGF